MVRDIITGVIGNYMISCFVLGLVVAMVQLARWGRPRGESVVSGLFLNAFLLYGIGIGQLINFVMHSVFGDFAAKSIGWAQSPFQLELALASLGMGIAAIIVHGRGSAFQAKTAIVIAMAVFGFGAAAGHIYQSSVNQDYAVNNTGLLLYGDVLINVIGLAFVVWHATTRRTDSVHLTDATVTPAPKSHAGTTSPTTPVADPTSSRQRKVGSQQR